MPGMKKALTIIGYILLLALACVISYSMWTAGFRHLHSQLPEGERKVKDQGSTGQVVEFKLDDGTRCVAMMTFGKGDGGISCDWKRP